MRTARYRYGYASIMRRAVFILFACVMCAMACLAWWVVGSRSQSSGSLGRTLESAVTNPVEFAKDRFTGGIGVGLGNNPAFSFPVINAVAASSPADKAGLHVGDLILQVDGLSTSNRPLRQIAEDVRGLSRGQVTLTIRRGRTNFECVVERASWNTLRGLSYKDE